MVELENIVREKRTKYISLLKIAEEIGLKEDCIYYEECIVKLDEILNIFT